jgi:hypothetical protein
LCFVCVFLAPRPPRLAQVVARPFSQRLPATGGLHINALTKPSMATGVSSVSLILALRPGSLLSDVCCVLCVVCCLSVSRSVWAFASSAHPRPHVSLPCLLRVDHQPPIAHNQMLRNGELLLVVAAVVVLALPAVGASSPGVPPDLNQLRDLAGEGADPDNFAEHHRILEVR